MKPRSGQDATGQGGSLAALGPTLAALLITKLQIPRGRAGAVRRGRLYERLDAALEAPLTLVAAPAGFGKTTLLAGWLSEKMKMRDARLAHPTSFAWLTLDPGDSDPVSFVRALVGALRLGGAAAGEATLAMLQSARPPPISAALVPLLNDLAELPGSTLLILDDYHLVSEPLIDEALAFAVERLPTHAHLIIASRAVPQLPLARLRARGQLIELGAAELLLTDSEVRDVLHGAGGPALDSETVARLAERTEGWPAALQLAILALRTQPDPAAFVSTFAGNHRYLFDYLVGELIDRQPPDRRDTLLRSAILERLSGPLCDGLLGLRPGSGAALLAQMERDGLLLLPLDDERRWYRYHQLFAEALRAQLRATLTSEQLADLYRCAAAVEPDPTFSIGYLIAARLWGEAADRIEACGARLLTRGQHATVQRLLEAMPPEQREARPGLCALGGLLASRQADLARAERLLERSLALSDARGDDAWRATAWAELALLALSRGKPERSAELAERALTWPAAPPARAASLMLAIFVQTLSGRREAAAGHAAELFAMLREPPDPQLRGQVLEGAPSLAVALLDQIGPLEDLCRAGLAASGGEISLARVGAEAGLAHIAWLRGRLDEALAMCERARRTSERFGTAAAIEPQLSSIAGLAAAAAGDLEGAAQAYTHALHSARPLGIYDATLPGRHYRLALVRWQQGRPGEARAAQAALAASTASSALGAAVDGLLDALSALADNDDERAEARLRSVSAGEAEVGLLAVFGSAHPLLAHLELRRGRPAAAATALAPLLEDCARHDTPGRLLMEGPYMIPLLQNAIEHGAYAAVAAAALALIQARHAERPAPHGLIEPLSDRELQVLRLLAAGRSNRAIAAELVVTVGTTKRHVSNLMAKLGAESRLAAVARGRELGLV